MLLYVSVCGDVQNVFMIHALKRISYATCNPSLCQFSFLARNRKAPPHIQRCHVFFTNTPQEVVTLVFPATCISVVIIIVIIVINTFIFLIPSAV